VPAAFKLAHVVYACQRVLLRHTTLHQTAGALAAPAVEGCELLRVTMLASEAESIMYSMQFVTRHLLTHTSAQNAGYGLQERVDQALPVCHFTQASRGCYCVEVCTQKCEKSCLACSCSRV
jgi:hypothetical protein